MTLTETEAFHAIGSTQTLLNTIETPWGTYAPGNLVTIHSGTETGWIIDLDPLPNMLGRPHRIEVDAAALSAWHPPSRSQVPDLPTPEAVIPNNTLADLYLNADVNAQIRAEHTLGTRALDTAVQAHDRNEAAA